jgi:hypothetical protein
MTAPADPTASANSAPMALRWNDPLAVEATAAVQRGQADRLRRLLDKHPELARVRIVKDGEAAGQRTLLHLFADWPGHRRNPQQVVAVLVAAGADPDAPGIPAGPDPKRGQGGQSQETPLHAAVFGGQRAGRRLVERGARTNLYQAAALGLTDRVQTALESESRPDPEQITTAFWAACGGDHQDAARLLLAAGADINWLGWNNQTPLDAARGADATALVAWLEAHGARPAPNTP